MTNLFSAQFRLSITEALSTQLYAALDRLEPTPLTQRNLDALARQAEQLGLPSMSGVYQLFRQELGKERELTYVGKADQPLPKRLQDHLYKLSGRAGISIDEMSFRCLFVEEDLSAVSPEKMLIKRHLKTGKIVWNNRGFGINDPGRERDTTRTKENHFDLEFPIDLSRSVRGLKPGLQPIHSVVQALKEAIYFNFRYDRRAALRDFKDVIVAVPEGVITIDEAFRLIAQNLSGGWQISALVGWAIMYNDDHRSYPSAFRYYRPNEIIEQQPETRKPGKGEMADDVEDEHVALF